jgi:lysophospholipase L1-like esterase
MYQKLGAYGGYALVHLEPDFYGYLQQYAVSIKTNASDIPAKVRYSDIPECSSLPENVGGLLSCMVKMGRSLSPKVRIGFHASMWGDWYDSSDPNAPILTKAASVGNFLKSVGSDQTDFIVLETTDRDAGFYEATQGKTGVYWDETNKTLPNFTGHFTWAKAVGQAMSKPLLWWQMPFGVPSATAGGTDGHYRDNRVHYFFSHMSDVAGAGGFGIVYGAGADRQTTPSTDGGQFKTALTNYLAAPTDLATGTTPAPTPTPSPTPVPSTGALDFGTDGILQLHTIGDSITNNPAWRAVIYNELTKSGYKVDFIGSMTDEWPQTSEKEHDGHNGYSTSNVLAEIDGWFAKILKPELTILMLGTNDVAWWIAEPVSNVVTRLNTLIDKIRANSPKGVILVASIPPESSVIVAPNSWDRSVLTVDYNKGVAGLVAKRNATGEAIYFVDIFASITTADLADGITPKCCWQS